MKTVSITDFLSNAQIKKVESFAKKYGSENKEFFDAVLKHIIEPNIKEINQKLGQENDPKYLTYAIQYVAMQLKLKKNPIKDEY
jgi:hypothetical protein